MALLYDSQASGNDFDGTHSVSAIGFTDVHGGVASFASNNLVLTSDTTNGGSDAFYRDYVVREAGGQQKKDFGGTFWLPPNFQVNDSTIGVVLRYQTSGSNCYLCNFSPTNSGGAQLSIYKIVSASVSTIVASINLTGTYNAANAVKMECLAVLNPCIVALRITDTVTGVVIGYLEAPANSESTLATATGCIGLVTWVSGSTPGTISISRIQTYTTQVIAFDGDSLTAGQNASSGFNSGTGGGSAFPYNTNYPGVAIRLLGSRFYGANFAVSGQTQAQINARTSTLTSALASAEQQPIVVIGGGTNDLGDDPNLGGTGLGYGLTPSVAAADSYARSNTYFSAMAAATYANGTGYDVIALTLTPAQHPVYTTNLGGPLVFDQRRDAQNALFLAGSSGAQPTSVLNIAAHPIIGFDGNELNTTYYSAADNTHMTDAGYAIKGAMVAAAILGSPAITSQPSNSTVAPGGTASFTVGSTGSPTIQWYEESTPLSGQTTGTATKAGVGGGDSGSRFTAVLSNASGIVASFNAVLTVNAPPSTAPTVTLSPTSSGVSVTIGTVAGATSYDLDADSTVTTGVTSPVSETVANLGTSHKYRARGVNSSGNGPWSAYTYLGGASGGGVGLSLSLSLSL